MVKPIAFAVVALFVVAAAGTGGYLAVRDNRNQPEGHVLATPAATSSEAGGETRGLEVVDDTEEAVAPPIRDRAAAGRLAAEYTAETKRPSESQRVVQRTVTSAAPVETAGAEPSPQAEAALRKDQTVVSAPSRRSMPERPAAIDGWERAAGRAQVFDVRSTPGQVALEELDSAALGLVVDPEARPRLSRELVIPADSVIGIQVDTPVSTADAKIEDDVEARVTRDVLVDDETAIPAGTRVLGSVVLVEQPGDLKGSARLGVRFHTVLLDDLYELPVATETVYREGKGRGSESAAKIGGAAVGGAILGAIFGGRKGAAIGSAAGAAGGTAAAMAGDGQPASLPAGSTLTVRLSRSATVAVEY